MGATKTSLTEYLPDLPNGRHCSEAPNSAFEAQRFWMAYSPWLAAHGYTLFDMVTGNGYMIPYWIPPLVAVSAPVPYAFYHRDENVPVTPWLMGAVETRFAFAQDAQGRNIAIKVIESDSEEEKIYQHLLHCSELFDPDTFASVLPPICILRSTYRFSFVLMPMWGDRPFIKNMKTVRQVMDFMTDMLRGLSFLHDQRIAHRDIAHTNLMINYFSPIHYLQMNQLRPLLDKHRSSSQARYCLFDFNLSKQFPSGQPIESYRSPSTEAFIGWDCFHPWDVYQGEFDYNPFAFDVACLGKLFMLRFAEVIPTVHMLAPLIDRMTTHIISQRFTAAQAHDFCTEIVRGMSEEVLGAAVRLPPQSDSKLTVQGCWDKVPHSFATLWSHYRSPPIPKSTRFLHWICSFEYGSRFVSYIRKTLRI